MTLVATDTGTDFTPAPAGTHQARCCQIIDLGTQVSSFYKDERTGEPKKQKKVLIGWELPSELNEDGEPFLVFKRYTVSLGDKANLRKDLEAWRGKPFTDEELKGFHLQKILGAPCMLSVIHAVTDGKTFANVNAVMALPKGSQMSDPVSPKVLFDIDQWDDLVFNEFGKSLQTKILASSEAIARGMKPAPQAAHNGAGNAATKAAGMYSPGVGKDGLFTLADGTRVDVEDERHPDHIPF